MSWIETHQSLPKHPKLIKAASLISMDRHKYMAHLICFWLWALDYADKDGNLPSYINEFTIAEGAEISRKRAINFVKSLINCSCDGHVGFLEWKDNHYTIHDWYDFAGTLIDQRNLSKEQRKQGGITRMSRLTPKDRSLLAQQGANARWASKHQAPEQGDDASSMPPDKAKMPATVPYPTVPNHTATATTDDKLAKFAELYQNTCGVIPNLIIQQEIEELSDRYSVEWFEAACKEASLSSIGRPVLNFIKSILVRWDREGFRSPLKYNGRGNNGHDKPDFSIKPKQPVAETPHTVDGPEDE